jgi:hypothetical protein
MNTGQHTTNEFLPTLGHAMRFRELTELPGPLGDLQSFSTATTFFCAATVEAAANGLLQLVEASRKVLDLIDRFPVIDKIDLVATARGKSINRGARAVQQLQELIQSRNGIVHPKIMTREVKFESLPGNEHYSRRHVANDFAVTDGSTEREIATKAVHTTVEFLNYAIADLLVLSQSEAEHCLIGVSPTEEKRPAYQIDSLRILLQYQRRYGHFRFINLPDIPGESTS